MFDVVVENLNCSKSTFIVIDAPSGSGKTLFGIALLLMDKDRAVHKSEAKRSVFESKSINLKVVHCIWPASVGAQDIYESIIKNQPSVQPNKIFERARFLAMDKILEQKTEICWIEMHVWFTVLQYVFETEKEKIVRKVEDFSVSKFLQEKNLTGRYLLIYVDEVPIKPSEIYVIYNLREAIKRVRSVGIALAGTNSKAANMIGLSEATSLETNIIPWALFVTRLPRFQIELSTLKDTWKYIKHTAREITNLKYALNAVESSLLSGGNPRLITLAISSLHKACLEKVNFYRWQEKFKVLVNTSKFSFKTYSGKFPEMNAQLNLLLEASNDAELSDIMLANHYAYRAVPDDGSESGTRANPKLKDCAGWLYLSEPSDCCLGRSLVYVNDSLKIGTYLPSVNFRWQTTVFAPVNRDILLYLGVCRAQGFFNCDAPNVSPFRTCEVVSACWKSNAAGSVNFQNPDAENNPGTKLEVMVTAAICNAAASLGKASSFANFLVQLGSELGVQIKDSATESLLGDSALRFLVPRYLFPGENESCDFGSLVGYVKRMKNKDQFNIKMTLPDNKNVVRVEVKDQRSFSNKDLWIVASKLFSSEKQMIGVLIVRECCNYWGTDVGNIRPSKNKERVSDFLRQLKGEKVGKVYFVKSDGEFTIENLGVGARRLILIQVACSKQSHENV